MAGIPLLILGFAVFLFDIKNCARAGAVAEAIWLASGQPERKTPSGLLGRLPEDVCFGMTISALNAFLLLATTGAFLSRYLEELRPELEVFWIGIGAFLFLVFFTLQTWFWLRKVESWGKQMDALPAGGAIEKKRK